MMREELLQLAKNALSWAEQDARALMKNAALNASGNNASSKKVASSSHDVIMPKVKLKHSHQLTEKDDANDDVNDAKSDTTEILTPPRGVTPELVDNIRGSATATLVGGFSGINTASNSGYNTREYGNISTHRLSEVFATPQAQVIRDSRSVSDPVRNTAAIYVTGNSIDSNADDNTARLLFPKTPQGTHHANEGRPRALSDNEKHDYPLSAAAIVSVYARYYFETHSNNESDFVEDFTAEDFRELVKYFQTHVDAATVLCDSFTAQRPKMEQWYKNNNYSYLARWEMVREETYKNRLKAVLESDYEPNMKLRHLSGATTGSQEQKQEELHLETVLMPYALYEVADTVYTDITTTFRDKNNRLALAREKALLSSLDSYLQMRRMAEKVVSAELTSVSNDSVLDDNGERLRNLFADDAVEQEAPVEVTVDSLLDTQHLTSSLIQGSFLVMQDYGSRTPEEIKETEPLLTAARSINGLLFMRRYLLPYCATKELSQLISEKEKIQTAPYSHDGNLAEVTTIVRAITPLFGQELTSRKDVGSFIGYPLPENEEERPPVMAPVSSEDSKALSQQSQVKPFHFVPSAAAIAFINAQYYLSLANTSINPALKLLLQNPETTRQDVSDYFFGHQQEAQDLFNAFMTNRSVVEAWYESPENAQHQKARQEKWKIIRVENFKNRIAEHKKNPQKKLIENANDQYLEQVLVPYTFYQSAEGIYENLSHSNESDKYTTTRATVLQRLEKPFLDVYNAAIEAGVDDHDTRYALAQIPLKQVVAHDLQFVSLGGASAFSQSLSKRIHKIFIENYFSPYVKDANNITMASNNSISNDCSIKGDVTEASFVQIGLLEKDLIADAVKKTREFYENEAFSTIKTQLDSTVETFKDKWLTGKGVYEQLNQLITKITENTKENNQFANGRAREYAREVLTILHGYPKLAASLKIEFDKLSVGPDYKVYQAAKAAFIYVSALGTKSFKTFKNETVDDETTIKTWSFKQWLDYFSLLSNVEKVDRFLKESDLNSAQLGMMLSANETEKSEQISIISAKQNAVNLLSNAYDQTIEENFKAKINDNILNCSDGKLDFHELRWFLGHHPEIRVVKLNPAMAGDDIYQMIHVLGNHDALGTSLENKHFPVLDFQNNPNLDEKTEKAIYKSIRVYPNNSKEQIKFLKAIKEDNKKKSLDLSDFLVVNIPELQHFLNSFPQIKCITLSSEMQKSDVAEIVRVLSKGRQCPLIDFNENPEINEATRVTLYASIDEHRQKSIRKLQRKILFLERMLEKAKQNPTVILEALVDEVKKHYQVSKLDEHFIARIENHDSDQGIVGKIEGVQNILRRQLLSTSLEHKMFSLRNELKLAGYESIHKVDKLIEEGKTGRVEYHQCVSQAQSWFTKKGKTASFIDWWENLQAEKEVLLTSQHVRHLIKPILFIYREYLATNPAFSEMVLGLNPKMAYAGWNGVNAISVEQGKQLYRYFLENRPVMEQWYKDQNKDYTAYWEDVLTEEYVAGFLRNGQDKDQKSTRVFNIGGMDAVLVPYDALAVFDNFGEKVQHDLPSDANEEQVKLVIQKSAAEGIQTIANALKNKFMTKRPVFIAGIGTVEGASLYERIFEQLGSSDETVKQNILTSFAGTYLALQGSTDGSEEKTPSQLFASGLFYKVYNRMLHVPMQGASSVSAAENIINATSEMNSDALVASWNIDPEYDSYFDDDALDSPKWAAGLSSEDSLKMIFSQQVLEKAPAVKWNPEKHTVDGNLITSTVNVFSASAEPSVEAANQLMADLPAVLNSEGVYTGRQIQINKADIHGNFLLFIQTLINLGVVTLPIAYLERLIELEAKFDVYGDVKIIDAQLAEMENIIAQHLKLNLAFKKDLKNPDSKAAVLRLIGDDRDDRGLLDYLTACVDDVLVGTQEEPGLEIVRLHSDHADMGFRPESNEAKKDASKVRSGINTQLLIKRGIITGERLERWSAFEERYKQSLKLMDYAIQMDDNGKPTALTLFSHGAVEQECLKALAHYFEVAYFDHNTMSLCQTIDAVNAKFNEMMSSVQGMKDYAAMMEAFDNEKDDFGNKFEINIFSESNEKAIKLKKNYPVLWILWSYKSDKKWQLGDGVPVTPICGHAANMAGKVYTEEDGICLDAKAGMINRNQECNISSITILDNEKNINTDDERNAIKDTCTSCPMLYLKQLENQSLQYVFVYKDDKNTKQQVSGEIDKDHYLYKALSFNELNLRKQQDGNACKGFDACKILMVSKDTKIDSSLNTEGASYILQGEDHETAQLFIIKKGFMGNLIVPVEIPIAERAQAVSDEGSVVDTQFNRIVNYLRRQKDQGLSLSLSSAHLKKMAEWSGDNALQEEAAARKQQLSGEILPAFQNLLSERHQDVFYHRVGTRENDFKPDKDERIAAQNKIIVASSYPSLTATLKPMMANVQRYRDAISSSSTPDLASWKAEFPVCFDKFKRIVNETPGENAILAQLMIALQQLCELEAETEIVDGEHTKYTELLVCFDDAFDLFKRKEWDAAKASAGFVSEVVSVLGKYHYDKNQLAKQTTLCKTKHPFSGDNVSESSVSMAVSDTSSSSMGTQHNQDALLAALEDHNSENDAIISKETVDSGLNTSSSQGVKKAVRDTDADSNVNTEVKLKERLARDLNIAINRVKPILSATHSGIYGRIKEALRSLYYGIVGKAKKKLDRDAQLSCFDSTIYQHAQKKVHEVSLLFVTPKAIGNDNTTPQPQEGNKKDILRV